MKALEGGGDADEDFGEDAEKHGLGENVEKGVEKDERVELDFWTLRRRRRREGT